MYTLILHLSIPITHLSCCSSGSSKLMFPHHLPKHTQVYWFDSGMQAVWRQSSHSHRWVWFPTLINIYLSFYCGTQNSQLFSFPLRVVFLFNFVLFFVGNMISDPCFGLSGICKSNLHCILIPVWRHWSCRQQFWAKCGQQHCLGHIYVDCVMSSLAEIGLKWVKAGEEKLAAANRFPNENSCFHVAFCLLVLEKWNN